MNNRSRLFYTILTAFLVMFSDLGSAGEKGQDVYRVAIDQDYAPYEFVDVDGEIKGFTPNLLREIGKVRGVSFRLIPMNWPDAVAGLEDGRIDLINMIRSPQRVGQYEFSEAHSYIKQGIFRNVSNHEITDLSSLAGHLVALQENDISLEMLAERSDFTRRLVQGKAEGFLLLNAGKVDAFLAAEQAGLRLIREYNLITVEPAAVGLFPRDYCFAARLGNRQLINLLNAGLENLKTAGSYDEIVETWLSPKVPEHGWFVHHWHMVAWFIGILLALLIGFSVWNVLLRKAVDQRTRAVRQSMDSLNEAQRIARLGSWEWDIESDSLYWSDETFRIFGIDRNEFGADFEAFISAVHPSDRQRVQGAVEEAVRAGTAEWTIDYRIIMPDGKLRFLHEEARTVFAQDGRVVKRMGTVQDVTDRIEAEQALAIREREYHTLLDSIPDFIVRYDTVLKRTYVNPAWEKASGLSRNELLNVPVADIPHVLQPTIPEYMKKIHKVLKSGSTESCAFFWRNAFGEELFLEYVIVPEHDQDGNISGALAIGRDMSEHKRFEDEMQRLNRKLKAISDCNQALMKAEYEQPLLDEVCRIICEEAGYRMAWVGFVEHNTERIIRPVAWAGANASYLEQTEINGADTDRGQGPSGIAVRTGKCSSIQDFSSDPQSAPWRDEALNHGFRSSIALPLKDNRGQVFGVLNIYSENPNTFSPEEITLLEKLAGDLAFGITVLRNRQKQQEAEKSLQEKQRLLLEAQRMAHIGNWWHDLVSGEIFWSDEFFRILGIEPQAPTPELATERFHPDDLPVLYKDMEESAAGKMEHEHEFRVVRPDGEIRWIYNHWIRVNDEEGREIKRVGTHQDITERKLAEEEIRQHLVQQKFLLDMYREMATAPVREILSFVVDRCVKLTASTIGFVGLISDDDQYMEAHIWSEKAMENCPLHTPTRFPLKEAGLWAEPVRQRKMIIVNDYSESHPAKKGCPKGHLDLFRFMGVPVLDKDRVVAVAAVANRREEYGGTDLNQVSLFMEGMWELVKRKRAEEDLRKLNIELDARVRGRTAELEEKNAELERMNKLFVGRELKMVELKNRVRELEEKGKMEG